MRNRIRLLFVSAALAGAVTAAFAVTDKKSEKRACVDGLCSTISIRIADGGLNLPDGATIIGDVDLSGTEIIRLPRNFRVIGNLDLRHSWINELPENLLVLGSLNLSRTGVTELPKNFVVGGSLDLSYTGILKLPEGLIVGHDLVLNNTVISSASTLRLPSK